MIGFLQPLWLLALSAAAIPALLHLRQRQTPPTVLFPAVRYLHQTKREQSQRLRLRNLLLLILRTLIILMIVLAAARPVATVSVGGVHAPTALAVILDNSLSSGVVLGGRRLSDVLVERAREVVDRVTDSDHLWLVLADGVPRRMSRIEAGRVLDSVAPQALRLDLAGAVRAASAAVEGDILPAHEVVVFSDRQASALSTRSGGAPAPAARVLFWESPAPVDNRGVDSARTEPGVWRPTGAVIAAIGGSGSASGALQLRVGDQELARSVAAPGERVALRPRLLQRGWFRASVEMDPDELRGDDALSVALRVAEPAAARANLGAGRFVREGLSVLQGSGRIGMGDVVVMDDRLMSGRGVMFPPADPVLVGAANRALTARGFPWRFGELQRGEWQLEGAVGPATGQAVLKRHRLDGTAGSTGEVLVTVNGEPWMVRDRDLVIVASRLEPEWTALPVSAAFVPFLDLLANEQATSSLVVVGAHPGDPVMLPPSARTVHTAEGLAHAGSDGRYAAPLKPGVYFLASATGDTVGALEVNHDPRESHLVPADRRALRATLGPEVQLLDTGALEREMFRGNRRADLSGLLIAAAVLAALVELFVATMGGTLGGRSEG